MLGLLCAAWSPRACSGAHRDQPFALEGIATFAPIEPQDLRLGAGLDLAPARATFLRLDVVQHEAGVTLNHRFKLADVLQLSAGLGVYYDFATRHPVPVVTLGHLTF